MVIADSPAVDVGEFVADSVENIEDEPETVIFGENVTAGDIVVV